MKTHSVRRLAVLFGASAAMGAMSLPDLIEQSSRADAEMLDFSHVYVSAIGCDEEGRTMPTLVLTQKLDDLEELANGKSPRLVITESDPETLKRRLAIAERAKENPETPTVHLPSQDMLEKTMKDAERDARTYGVCDNRYRMIGLRQ